MFSARQVPQKHAVSRHVSPLFLNFAAKLRAGAGGGHIIMQNLHSRGSAVFLRAGYNISVRARHDFHVFNGCVFGNVFIAYISPYIIFSSLLNALLCWWTYFIPSPTKPFLTSTTKGRLLWKVAENRPACFGIALSGVVSRTKALRRFAKATECSWGRILVESMFSLESLGFGCFLLLFNSKRVSWLGISRFCSQKQTHMERTTHFSIWQVPWIINDDCSVGIML